MMADYLTSIRDLIQQDVGRRGLATDPVSNLLTACPDDFAAACHSIANTPEASVAVVTGFFIPTAEPPAGETDGPLGAIFLARALAPLGIRVAVISDGFCRAALSAGLEACDMENSVRVLILPDADRPWDTFKTESWLPLFRDAIRPTHLIALERVGPSHTRDSIEHQSGKTALLDFLSEVPEQHHDRCHTMRGMDITNLMSRAHLLFETPFIQPGLTTIGIGDGGNEIGMGKIPWEVLRRNIAGGAITACRVATDYLIVSGISNWGAYGLAAGVWALRSRRIPAELLDVERERRLLQTMVERGPLVDGMTGRPAVAVDGLPFDHYAQPLVQLAKMPFPPTPSV